MSLIQEVLLVLESIDEKLPENDWVTLELYSDGSGSIQYWEGDDYGNREKSHEVDFRNLEHLAEIVGIHLAEMGEADGETNY